MFFLSTLCLPIPLKRFVGAAETTWKHCYLNMTTFSYQRSLNIPRCGRNASRKGVAGAGVVLMN